MRIKLKTAEIQEYLKAPACEFPRYTTQLMNLANQNSQGTRAKIVGQMSDLIQECQCQTFDEWVRWYREKHPDAISNATDRVYSMIENLNEASPKIDREMVRLWVEDLVLVKTFAGLKFQEAILRKLAEIRGCAYRLSNPYEESTGIDGFVGEEAFSIKPVSYTSKKPTIQDSINIQIIYYEKKKDGIVFEIPDEPMTFELP